MFIRQGHSMPFPARHHSDLDFQWPRGGGGFHDVPYFRVEATEVGNPTKGRQEAGIRYRYLDPMPIITIMSGCLDGQ